MSCEKYCPSGHAKQSAPVWSKFDQSAEIGACRGNADPLALLHLWQGLRSAGFTLTFDGDRLRVSPADRLSEEQDAVLRTHKADWLALFTAALAILQTLYAQHIAHLVEGGHDGKSALVNRKTYWAALHKAGIPTDTVFELLDLGWIRTQADGLYWVPGDLPETPNRLTGDSTDG